MFDKATRMKIRFETSKGSLSVEDLWDLPLTSTKGPSIDAIAVDLDRQLGGSTRTSFVHASSPEREELRLKFDVAKHILDVKVAEVEEAKSASLRRAKKERILEILAKKQDADLESLPREELERLAADL